jgi:hypothetical protein
MNHYRYSMKIVKAEVGLMIMLSVRIIIVVKVVVICVPYGSKIAKYLRNCSLITEIVCG